MTDDRTRAALEDLDALRRQAAAGEIDERTARRLWVRYASEAVDAASAARVSGEAATDGETGGLDSGADHDRLAEPAPRRPRASLWVAGAVVVAAAGAAATVTVATDERAPGGFVTGNEVTDPGTAQRDLSVVTNEEMEQVVAANPDIVDMRARLAHRYLDDGDLDRAVDHYLEVLDRHDHPEAMSHLGWILFTQGRSDLAAPLIERSRELDPADVESTWFMANLLVYGQERPGEAIPLLEGLLVRDELGSDQREDVASVLDDALEALAASEGP